MSLDEEEIQEIRASIAQQNENIESAKLREELEELSQFYQIEARAIFKDLKGNAGQRSISLNKDLEALSKDIKKIHEDLIEGQTESFQRDVHDLDQVIMELERIILYTLTAFNLAKKSNTLAKYNAKNDSDQKIPETRINSNNSVMNGLQSQMTRFHDSVKGLLSKLEEINRESNEQLNSELTELSKLIHYIEYFAETGTPDPEIRGKLEDIEEEYDRKVSRNLKEERENARKTINKLIRSQSREI